jgi:hypothetical protein
MATLVYPPSETHTHSTAGLFSSSLGHDGLAGSSRTYSATTQSPPVSPLKYTSVPNPNLSYNLPPATDSLIAIETQPSFTARLHRRKKTYKPPSTVPPTHASQPHDPLRAARLAWRMQEEYAEQLRIDEEQMRSSTHSFQRQQQQQPEFIRQTAPTSSRPPKRKKVKSKWQSFMLWLQLGLYRFTRSIRNIFK